MEKNFRIGELDKRDSDNLHGCFLLGLGIGRELAHTSASAGTGIT